jgi:integrase
MNRQRVKVVQQRYRDKATGETKLSSTLYLQYSVGGKQVRKPTGTTDSKTAERLRKQLEAQLTLGQEPEAPRVQRTTFEDLSALLLTHYTVNGLRSKDRVAYALDNLKVTFAGQKATTITSDRVSAYTGARKKTGAANATINQELAALRRMFSLGERDGLVNKAPRIDLLRLNNARKGFFERPQYLAVRAALPDPLQPLVDVAYITGWRVKSELLTRQWKHVDGNWLRLEPGETKNGEGRMFPLTPELKAVLDQQRAATLALQKESGIIVPWLFHRGGRRIKGFARAWRAAVRRAGVPERIPHDFRRTAVRNLERAGVSRSAAMKMVGHKTESIYRRYAVVSEADLREAAGQLAALHARETGPEPRKVVPLR